MSEKRFTKSSETFDGFCDIFDNGVTIACMRMEYSQNVVNLLNSLNEENERLKNELRKEKSLLEYSDSMYNTDLIVNVRFSKGEWKADVSVIDNE